MKEHWGIDSMGDTAENVAEKYAITRETQDLFAFGSQMKAKKATENHLFAEEIAPLDLDKGQLVEKDEFPRPGTTLETLAALKPAFRLDGKGSVTAGNSSGINDGSCALLIASEAGIQKLSGKPLARIVASSAAGVEPRLMGMGPVPATKKLLSRCRISLDDVSIIEINEAFAAQCVASLRELGVSPEDPRVNPQGGAISLGHPLGMTGARLALTAARQLDRSGGKYAVCTMCVGVGQGVSLLLERV
jgi:acetyl-CoA acyltransferase